MMNNKRCIKKEIGAISIFTLLSMLFFLVFILGISALSMARNRTQIESLTEIKSIYKKDSDIVYNSRVAAINEVIPIYTAEQLHAIGSEKTFEIDGRIYRFTKGDEYNAVRYMIKAPIYISSDYEIPVLDYGTIDKNNNIYKYASDAVVHYDGIYNTRTGHSMITNKWEDLSGNNNDAIFMGLAGNMTWEDKAYNFVNSSTNYFETQNLISISNKPRTIEIVLSLEENLNNSRNIIGFGKEGANGIVDVMYIANGVQLHVYGNSATEGITTEPLELHKIYSNSIIYENAKTWYRTNQHTKNNVSFYNLNTGSSKIFLGIGIYGYYNNNNRFKIQALRIYDRVLTQEEIQNNYGLDRKRFEITED